jgi:hypothetical protein
MERLFLMPVFDFWETGFQFVVYTLLYVARNKSNRPCLLFSFEFIVLLKFLLLLPRQMNAPNKIQASLLEPAIRESLKNYEVITESGFLWNLYLVYNSEENTLSFYDDLENFLHKLQLPDDEQLCRDTLRSVLQELNRTDFFNKNYIIKPFTVGLVDDFFFISEELFVLNSSAVKPEKHLWKDLEKDLDNFLKKLLS